MLILAISAIARVAFLIFQTLLLRRSVEEREFYNDIVERIQDGRYSDIPNVRSWLPDFPRIAIEGIFFLFVLVPTLFTLNGFDWQGMVLSILYLVAVMFIYNKRKGRLFSTNEVLWLNGSRLVFIVLSFLV